MKAGAPQITPIQLREWAGTTIFTRGQDYELRGRVRDLALIDDEWLLAWVQGTERYATCVRLHPDELAAECTCPYAGTCKHAVAVALAYLNRPRKAAPLPIAAADDPRLVLLESQATTTVTTVQTLTFSGQAGSATPQAATFAAFLATYTQTELVALLGELAQRFPAVHADLAMRRMLANDDSDELEAEVRERILAATTAVGSSNYWDHNEDEDEDAPDYSPVYDGLELLVERGYADAVVRLGEELLDAGISQLGQIQDDGVTFDALASCLTLVFQALPASTLAPDAQIHWTIDAMMRDPYGLCCDAPEVLEQPYPATAWSKVADDLLSPSHHLNLSIDAVRSPSQRLNLGAKEFSHRKRREQLINFALMALEKAGRTDEIIPLCEHEAHAGSGYQRLVKHLIAAGRRDEAEQWARTGIAATISQDPGIASSLRQSFCALRSEAGDWAMVAALHAESFFDHPSRTTFDAMVHAAESAGCGADVHAIALAYLESGQRPQPVASQRGATTIPAWPLPATNLPRIERPHPPTFPQLEMLINLAISEGRASDVLRWYDQRSNVRYAQINDDAIADAIVAAYPERAAAIWQRMAESFIAATDTASYNTAANYLRKLRRLWTEAGRLAEWRSYVEALRTTNKRKRRLVEILDHLLQA